MEKILRLGTHLELVPAGIKADSEEGMEKRYTSSVHEIVDEETVLITNPTLRSRIIPLHKNEKYDCFIYVGKKSYSCRMMVESSTMDGRIRVVQMRLLSGIEKYERRKYFRLDVMMDLRYLMITPENSADFRAAVLASNLLQMPGFKPAFTLDISGGGLKFQTEEKLPEGGNVVTHLETTIAGKTKKYIFLGKILSSVPKENIRGHFVNRMEFVDLNQASREEFVRYIFEKERENLKKNGSL